MVWSCCLNTAWEQLSQGTNPSFGRVPISFTLSAVWEVHSPAQSLQDDYKGKLCRNNSNETLSCYSAAPLLESFKLLCTKRYCCVSKNIRENIFKMWSSRRALLRAGNSQETLVRWSVIFKQHVVSYPLGFKGLFKLDICRQCIIYSQKHE